MSVLPHENLSPVYAALILLALLLLPRFLPASETVVLRVFLNTEDKGDYFMQLTEDGDVLLQRADFFEIGFRDVAVGMATSGEDVARISLKSLFPLVSFAIDEREAELRITAEPGLLEKSIVDLSYAGPADVDFTWDTAAFLNYSVGYRAGNEFDFDALRVPWEAGISIDGKLGFSSFSYTKTDEEKKFVRLFSNITADDRITLRRIVIGDFSAFSGTLGSGGVLGGLSISKNFSIRPNFRRFPGLNISGMLETPSDVELYVNNHLVKSEQFSAGAFEFMNLPYATGAADATLVIRDAYGREVRVENPFYLSTQLLKPGLNDYSYNLGCKREEFGNASFDYSDLTFIGFHRYGFTRDFTGGVRAEADKNLVNLGGSATFVPWRLGETNASFAISNREGHYGSGGILSYFHSGGPVSGGFTVSGFSREYANLGFTTFNNSPRFERSVSLGFNQRNFGSISATYSATDFYQEADRRRVSLYYSKNLWRDTSLQLRASRVEWDDTVNEVFASLVVFLGGNRTGSLSYQVRDGRSSETASLQKNSPLGPGIGYRLLLDRNEDGQGDRHVDGNVAVQYRGPYGIYSVGYNRIAEEENYDVSASGGVAFINKSVYLSRPISDGFALVKVGDLDGVKVSYSNQDVGTTNRNGKIVVPNLISYYDNDLSIEARDIPVNYEIKQIRKYVSPPVRGGSIVEFPVAKLQGFTGYLYVQDKGQRTPAQYWGLRISVAGKPREFTVGKVGEFYFENIPVGKYQATLFWRDRECRFDLTIPQSEDIMVDMGELTCEIN